MSIKSNAKHSKKKQKSNSLGNFIIILVIFAGGAALVMNADFQKLINKFSDGGDVSASTAIFDDQYSESESSDRVLGQVEEEIGAGGDEGVLSFAPEDSMDEFVDGQVEEFHPYSQIVKEDEAAANAARIEQLENAFEEYRLYIENANRLLVKFAADEIYSEEMALLRKIPCSEPNAQEVLMLLEFYNKQLVEQGPVTSEVVDIKLLDSEVLEKIVKVKKVRMSNVDQRDLKEKIEAKLGALTDYIFSASLQKSFMNK